MNRPLIIYQNTDVTCCANWNIHHLRSELHAFDIEFMSHHPRRLAHMSIFNVIAV